MIKRILLLGILFLLALPSVVHAAGTNDGVIDGRVVNGTAGGDNVVNLEVTLVSQQNTSDPGIKTTTDADGHFSFSGLSTESSYVAYLYYFDVVYVTSVSFEQDLNTASAEIIVYNTTTSDSAISIYQYTVAIIPNGDDLEFAEQIYFYNEGNTTYIGPVFSFPKIASDTYVEANGIPLADDNIYSVDTGFTYGSYIQPNGYYTEILAHYWIKGISQTNFAFSKIFEYPTSVFYLRILDTGEIRVTSNQLTSEKLDNNQGQSYYQLSGSNLSKDTVLNADISGLPGVTIFGPHKVIGEVLLLIAGILVIVYLVAKRYGPSLGITALGSDPDKERLLQEMAYLDDEFEAGNISVETYEKTRSEKKMQLSDLIRKLEERGNGE